MSLPMLAPRRHVRSAQLVRVRTDLEIAHARGRALQRRVEWVLVAFLLLVAAWAVVVAVAAGP